MRKSIVVCSFLIGTQLFIGCGSSQQSVAVVQNITHDSKISLYDFELLQEHLMMTPGGIISDGIVAQYYIALRMEMTRIFEDSLKSSGNFKFYPAEQLITQHNEKPMPVDSVIKENKLTACITGRAGLGYTGLMGKKLFITTTWKIVGPMGRYIEIETDATTEDTYGFIPERTDPALRPVWIDLAKKSVKEFKVKLAEMMKDAGKIPTGKM